jgi:TetR/AcrR family transcriptional regulator
MDGLIPPDNPDHRPRRHRASDERIDRILTAAVAVFSRVGLDGARIEAIAREAGMSKTNLLYYFPTKERLYTAALDRVLDRWLVPLRDMDVEDDPVAAIRGYIAEKLDWSRRDPAASRLFAMEMLRGAPLLKPLLEGALRDLVDEKSQIIRGWITAGRLAPVDPRHLIFAIWATTQHYADFAVQVEAVAGHTLDDPAFATATADALTRLLLDGLRPRA